jgi:hypothetical protein
MSGVVDAREVFLEGDPRRPRTGSASLGRGGGRPYQPEEEAGGRGESDKYAGLGIGVAGLLAENLVCHPFIILRRQCQVVLDWQISSLNVRPTHCELPEQQMGRKSSQGNLSHIYAASCQRGPILVDR